MVSGLGPENIGYERLWVAAVEGEPDEMHLHHHPVARQENVVRGGQCDPIQ
jgi:hypothetical protein